ncbi:MAG: endonuclease [Flavobacteriaceae bacterium]|nr:endonuclease [Flavobacteriaceae bacterium]
MSENKSPKLYIAIEIFAVLAIVLTLIPLIAIDYWWIRVFDFPHIQLTILTLVAFILFFVQFHWDCWQDYIVAAAIAACFVFQYSKIHAYLPYATLDAKNTSENYTGDILKIYTANVLQKNKKPEKLQKYIDTTNADILLFMETDTQWQQQIQQVLPQAYRYKVEVPLDNTYGVLLYSKLELTDVRTRYLVDDSIPSIDTKVLLPNGDKFQLFVLHPTPPMPQHNPSSSDRDAEMMKYANLSRESELPVVILGDFNDVPWSATTSLFRTVGEVLDIRRGRGFYNSFNANNFLMRWPLDHVFVSSEFRVKKFITGEDINSDHFPTYTELSFEPQLKDKQKPVVPTEEELKRAKEQAEGVRKMELDY